MSLAYNSTKLTFLLFCFNKYFPMIFVKFSGFRQKPKKMAYFAILSFFQEQASAYLDSIFVWSCDWISWAQFAFANISIFKKISDTLVTKVQLFRFCAKPCRLGPKRQGVNFSAFSWFWRTVENSNFLKKMIQKFKNFRTVSSNTVFQKPAQF